jgi:Ca-activated chloride channel homolog
MKTSSRRVLLVSVSCALVGCATRHETPRAVADVVTRAEQQADSPPPIPESMPQESISRDELAKPGRDKAERKVAAAQGGVLQSLSSVAIAPAACCVQTPSQNTERYQHIEENLVHVAASDPVSTFSIDVDTGSYANVRRFLTAGQLPPSDAVRVEEMLNYFDYSYAPPEKRDVPFRVTTELAPAPWNADALLMRVGIKGYVVPAAQRPASNLVFLIDVSGSMDEPDKLPLLKNGLRLLTNQLGAKDRVAIVVYAGSAGVVLESTAGDHHEQILAALDRLQAGGSTNGGAGIERAYRVARENFIEGGINRVVLATDGDFNVGVVSFDALLDVAKRERKSGVALTALGFGTGNYNDQLMERLADAGDGNYAYVDTITEARKVLVDEISSTLMTIAKDVKIQVEFNPAQVAEYRLIGYENRALAREDFNNDQVDAGEIGAGHRVTALYEIIPTGKPAHIDPLRYGATGRPAASKSSELAYVRLRYKQPDSDKSQLLEYPIERSSVVSSATASADFRFAASVAAFGQKLRGGKYLGAFGYEEIRQLANAGLSADRDGYRHEFVNLIQLAQSLTPQSGASQQVGMNISKR